MIKLFYNFQNLMNSRPRFNIKYITMECPEFIVKLLMGRQYSTIDYDIYFGDEYISEQLNLKH
ncbi:hypothetical protein MASR2M47_43720 [Draconibacterium sp.]